MKLWIQWWVTLAIYGLLNYLFVWMGSTSGIGAYFMWGTTLPVAAMITMVAVIGTT